MCVYNMYYALSWQSKGFCFQTKCTEQKTLKPSVLNVNELRDARTKIN